MLIPVRLVYSRLQFTNTLTRPQIRYSIYIIKLTESRCIQVRGVLSSLFRCPCMAIYGVSAQFNGAGSLPDIILLALRYATTSGNPFNPIK